MSLKPKKNKTVLIIGSPGIALGDCKKQFNRPDTLIQLDIQLEHNIKYVQSSEKLKLYRETCEAISMARQRARSGFWIPRTLVYSEDVSPDVI